MKRACALVLVFVAFGLLSFGVQADYYDFGGETIHILAQSHDPSWRFLEGDWRGANRYGTAYGLHLEAEERFNCKLEFHVYGWGEYPEVLTTRLLSGDSENDLWAMTHFRFWQLMPQGAFLPLNDFFPAEYFANLPGMPRAQAEYLSFAGQRFGFGAIGGSLASMVVIVYQKEVFDELGLPDLQELYFAGEWTWDALEEIAALATADTTGDGDIDRWGIAGLGRLEHLLPFAHTNANAAMTKEVEGRMTFAAGQPDFVDAIGTVREWMERRIAFPEAGPVTDFVPGVIRGDNAMAITAVDRITTTVTQVDPDARYSIVPLPMGPAATEHIHGSSWIDTAFTLPVNSRHPEGMLQLIEFLYPVDDYLSMVDEVIHTVARDRQSAQILWEMHDNWSGFVPFEGPPVQPAMNALNEVLRGERMMAGAMAEVATVVQNALDELFAD